MIGLGTATAQLDTSVNIAFPAITRGFDLAISDIQWVVICYVLTYASLPAGASGASATPSVTRSSTARPDLERVALLLVGYAPSYGAMLFFSLPARRRRGSRPELPRGAGNIALWRRAARPGARHLYHDMALGLMLGPLLGGACGRVDWPAVFWFRIPIAMAALLLLRGMPAPPPRQAGGRFDILGGIALIVGLVTMLLALNRLREFAAVPLGLFSVVAFAGFGSGSPAPNTRSSQPEFFNRRLCAAEPRQRDGQSRGLFGLAAGALLSHARARPYLAESGAILAAGAAGAVLASPIGGRLIERLVSARGWRSRVPP